jgi:hypothetical protein
MNKSFKGKEASVFNEEDYKSDVLAKSRIFTLLYRLGAKKLITEAESELLLEYHRDLECDLDNKHLIISAERRSNWVRGHDPFPFSTINILNRKSNECNSKNRFTTFAVCSFDLKGIAVIKYDVFDKLNPVEISTRRGLDWVRQVPLDEATFYRLIDEINNVWEIKKGNLWRTLP